MALFYECMQWCAHIVLDMADIVRDRDITSTGLGERIVLDLRQLPEEEFSCGTR
jgi:hypothetical protein